MRTIEQIEDDFAELEQTMRKLNRAYDSAPDGSQAKHDAVTAIDAALQSRSVLEREINAVLGE